MTATGATSKESEQEKERVTLSRLADRGEEALQRLADLPGGTKAMKAFNDLKTRVDELGRKVRGIDALERRVAKLEKELAALKRSQKATKPATTRQRTPS